LVGAGVVATTAELLGGVCTKVLLCVLVCGVGGVALSVAVLFGLQQQRHNQRFSSHPMSRPASSQNQQHDKELKKSLISTPQL